MLAFDEAVELYDRALALTRPADDGQRRCEILMSLGEALWLAASSERAVSVYGEAAEIAEQRGDAETLAEPFSASPRPHTLAPPREQATPLLEKALELLPPADSALRALLTARPGSSSPTPGSAAERRSACATPLPWLAGSVTLLR